MSNRFLYFFLSTYVVITIYFNTDYVFRNDLSTSEIYLHNFLYSYDYLIFLIYLVHKYLKYKDLRILLLAFSYVLLLSFTVWETVFFYQENWIYNLSAAMIFQSISRIFIALALFNLNFDDLNSKLKKLVFAISAIAITIIFNNYFKGGLLTKYPYKVLTNLYFSIFFVNILLSIFRNGLPIKTNHLILLFSLITLFITDYFAIQNYILQKDIYNYAILRIFNTLGELGLVYFILISYKPISSVQKGIL